MQKVKKCLFVFDFDHTILESNSDYVIDNLFPGHKKPSDLVLGKHENWTTFMQKKFNKMNQLNISVDQILEYLRRQPLTDGFRYLFEQIKSHEKIIISDSNSQFIDSILDSNGIIVDSIFTNHSWIEDDTIQIKKHHEHGCKKCPVNLCKQEVLKEYVGQTNYDNIVYIGDGGNDYCPLLYLRSCDIVFARQGYRLQQIINQKKDKLDCHVHIFEDGSQILQVLSNLQIV